MRQVAGDLEETIAAAYRVALQAERLDVAEYLLQALERLARECPQAEESVAEAYLMIGRTAVSRRGVRCLRGAPTGS